MNTKKAIIYCRVACADQQSISQIAAQETDCRLYAEKNGYEVVQAFHDEGVSGLTVNRAAFKLMLVTLLAAPEPYTVITQDMVRISRDVSDFASVCQILGGLGSEIVFVADQNPHAGRSA